MVVRPAQNLGLNFIEAVRAGKSQSGPHLIMCGGSTLTTMLFEEALIDEVVLLVYPVLLGLGKRIFEDSLVPREISLVSTRVVSSDVLMNIHQQLGSVQTEATVGASD